MPKFFVDEFNGKLENENAYHAIKSLRIKPGERLLVGDLHLFDYDCVVSKIEDNTVFLDLLQKRPNNTEPSVFVTLYQCMLKGDKMGEVVKHAVELGVGKIVPVLNEYCVKIPRDEEKLVLRLQKISEAAAKQSLRGIIPKVEMPVRIEDVPKNTIAFYEVSGSSLSSAVSDTLKETPQNINILIGCEGGLAYNEAEMFKYKVHLGNRILKAETAPVVALSAIMHITGNLED